MIEERTLLELDREVDDGDVRIVERIENIRFPEIKTLKL
jgi:hypothetical protein